MFDDTSRIAPVPIPEHLIEHSDDYFLVPLLKESLYTIDYFANEYKKDKNKMFPPYCSDDFFIGLDHRRRELNYQNPDLSSHFSSPHQIEPKTPKTVFHLSPFFCDQMNPLPLKDDENDHIIQLMNGKKIDCKRADISIPNEDDKEFLYQVIERIQTDLRKDDVFNNKINAGVQNITPQQQQLPCPAAEIQTKIEIANELLNEKIHFEEAQIEPHIVASNFEYPKIETSNFEVPKIECPKTEAPQAVPEIIMTKTVSTDSLKAINENPIKRTISKIYFERWNKKRREYLVTISQQFANQSRESIWVPEHECRHCGGFSNYITNFQNEYSSSKITAYANAVAPDDEPRYIFTVSLREIFVAYVGSPIDKKEILAVSSLCSYDKNNNNNNNDSDNFCNNRNKIDQNEDIDEETLVLDHLKAGLASLAFGIYENKIKFQGEKEMHLLIIEMIVTRYPVSIIVFNDLVLNGVTMSELASSVHGHAFSSMIAGLLVACFRLIKFDSVFKFPIVILKIKNILNHDFDIGHFQKGTKISANNMIYQHVVEFLQQFEECLSYIAKNLLIIVECREANLMLKEMKNEKIEEQANETQPVEVVDEISNLFGNYLKLFDLKDQEKKHSYEIAKANEKEIIKMGLAEQMNLEIQFFSQTEARSIYRAFMLYGLSASPRVIRAEACLFFKSNQIISKFSLLFRDSLRLNLMDPIYILNIKARHSYPELPTKEKVFSISQNDKEKIALVTKLQDEMENFIKNLPLIILKTNSDVNMIANLKSIAISQKDRKFIPGNMCEDICPNNFTEFEDYIKYLINLFSEMNISSFLLQHS